MCLIKNQRISNLSIILRFIGQNLHTLLYIFSLSQSLILLFCCILSYSRKLKKKKLNLKFLPSLFSLSFCFVGYFFAFVSYFQNRLPLFIYKFKKNTLNLEFLPSLFSLSFCFVDYFFVLSIIFRIGYLYLFFILSYFHLFSSALLPLFHVQNCLSAFWLFLPFISPLLIHWRSYFAARVKTDVKPVSRVALLCSAPLFSFMFFVCYKLSWFINLSRLFKGVCITKQEK